MTMMCFQTRRCRCSSAAEMVTRSQ